MMVSEDAYFSRQRRLPAIDMARLRQATVLVGGVGNVGGPAAAYLALDGVGKLVLVDKDVVRPENLSRGIFEPGDLGKAKVQAALDWIARRAPFTEVTTLCADLLVGVPETLFGSCDAVVIATDSWSSRMHANRWAHALPDRARVVVSGGMAGLSWDVVSSVPGSGLGCAQCPHSPDILRSDEEGGCSPQSGTEEGPIDPSAALTGGMVAAVMAMEVVAALGGSGPKFAGKMLSFNFEDGGFHVRRIVPNPQCLGHRPLAQYEEVVTVALADYRLRDLARRVAEQLDEDPGEVALASDREIVRRRRCAHCGHVEEVRKPLLTARRQWRDECCRCGGRAFEVELHTLLDEEEMRLSEIGLVPGKVLQAHVAGRKVTVVQTKEGFW